MHQLLDMTRTDDLIHTLQLAEKSVARERNVRLTAIGLTSAQAQILTVLHRQGPMSLNELNGELPTDVPPSRVVSALVQRRFVTRRDQANDRRHVELALSKLGKKKFLEVRRVERALRRWVSRKLQRMPVAAANKALRALIDHE